MKNKNKLTALLLVTVAMLLIAVPVGAGKDNPISMNAQFMKWQEKANILHIFVHDDDGRSHIGPAYVDAGQPLIFGFEWGDPEGTIEDLEAYVNDPGHDLTLTITGDVFVSEFSVKGFYQEAFYSETQSGPAWSWDHDGDGPYDGDGDGFGDWSGPIVFFRYPYPGLPSGTYYFTFTLYDDFTLIYAETITVIVP